VQQVVASLGALEFNAEVIVHEDEGDGTGGMAEKTRNCVRLDVAMSSRQETHEKLLGKELSLR
jgi:hypothetical protein